MKSMKSNRKLQGRQKTDKNKLFKGNKYNNRGKENQKIEDQLNYRLLNSKDKDKKR